VDHISNFVGMQRFVKSLAALFVAANSWGQSTEIIIIDCATKSAIPLAHLALDSKVYYSDRLGKFPRALLSQSDLTISCIGYAPAVLNANAIMDTICLQSQHYELPAVAIGGNFSPYEIGWHKEKTKIRVGSRLGENSIQAFLVPSENIPVRIQEIIIPFAQIPRSFEFEVYLFDVDSSGAPGELLLTKKVEHDSRRKTKRIDVSKALIQIPDSGIYVGIYLPYNLELDDRNDDLRAWVKGFVNDDVVHYVFYRNVWLDMDVRKQNIEDKNFYMGKMKIGLQVVPF
jgi:hypothetical protein